MDNNKLNNEHIFKIMTMIFFVISPIFDMVFLYNHITTLLRVFIIMIFLLWTLILYKESRKKIKYLVIYYLLMVIYLTISYFHAQGFKSYVPDNFNFSLISEATTLIKLAMPFTILFIMKYQKYSKKDFFIVVNSWVLIVAGSIVLCNIFGYSLSSYTDEITRYSIFSWRQDLSVRLTATKGFFAFANQEAVVLILLLVLTIYEFLFENKKSLILVFLIMFACLMLGTRISTYGGVLVVVVISIFYLIYSLIMKRKASSRILGIIPIVVIWSLLIPISPNNDRIQEMQNAQESALEGDTEVADDLDEDFYIDDDALNYIEQNINHNIIGRQFYLDYYPYQYDTEFWNEVIELQSQVILDYRVLEIMIIDRIVEVDGRASNYLLGITNSRIQNVVNIERDFVLHFYAYGIIGSLITLLYYIYSLFKLGKKVILKKDFMSISIFACLFLFITCAYLSGNALNFLATIIPCAFITGSLQHKIE